MTLSVLTRLWLISRVKIFISSAFMKWPATKLKMPAWLTLGSHYVEKLVVDIVSCKKCYKLSECLSTRNSLLQLKLYHCSFRFPLPVYPPALKKIYLVDCEMSDDAILDFASGCPLLEELLIEDGNNYSSLSIVLRNPSLITLKLGYNSGNDGRIKIDEPYSA